ncbi:MAG: hypothetical protein LBC95_01255 [Candidatus Nomurabacteria bacterium]|jgi:hypothetical protein|nr:hypothetical protein [Candidatus Nomurabacteria bacterium]
MGTHQKIDRVVRRKLQPHIPSSVHFPTAKEILKFEGLNGPDGIKRKSPVKDEPWHLINPTNAEDRQILPLIQGHENNLIQALRDNNRERAAFEAAWLAHAITDGLTPAHHYPYKEMRDALLGEHADTEATVAKKLWRSGDTLREKSKNNFEYYKPNGLGVGSAHLYFELGVASLTAALRFKEVRLTPKDRLRIQRAGGIVPLYMDIVWQVYDLHLYDKFLKSSWTPRLARAVKNDLMPTIIHTVLLSWYYCVWRAAQE